MPLMVFLAVDWSKMRSDRGTTMAPALHQSKQETFVSARFRKMNIRTQTTLERRLALFPPAPREGDGVFFSARVVATITPLRWNIDWTLFFCAETHCEARNIDGTTPRGNHAASEFEKRKIPVPFRTQRVSTAELTLPGDIQVPPSYKGTHTGAHCAVATR